MQWSTELNSPIPIHFSSLIPKMSMFNLVLFDNIQFTLIRELNIPGSYAILFFTTSALNFTTRHIPTKHHFHFGWATSFFLELLITALHSSLVACCIHSNLGWCSSPGVKHFAFSYCSWDAPGKNTGMGYYFLLQWTVFCQNSSLWPICLGQLCTAWLIISFSYASPFTIIRLWFTKGIISPRSFHTVSNGKISFLRPNIKVL